MHIWSDKIIKLVQNPVDNFHQQMTLLIFQCRRHQQWQDLVEEWPGSHLTCLVCDLSQGSLTHWWCAILDLQEKLHDAPFFGFFCTEGALIYIILFIRKRE